MGTAFVEGEHPRSADGRFTGKRASEVDGGLHALPTVDPVPVTEARNIGDERAGRGREPRSVEDFGFVRSTTDHEALQAYDLLGVSSPWWDDEGDPDSGAPWTCYATTTVLGVDDVVHTGQDYVSGTYLRQEATAAASRIEDDGAYAKPGATAEPWTLPRLYASSDGRVWCLDGHHTICMAREAGAPCRVQVIDHATLDEIRADLLDEAGWDEDDWPQD